MSGTKKDTDLRTELGELLEDRFGDQNGDTVEVIVELFKAHAALNLSPEALEAAAEKLSDAGPHDNAYVHVAHTDLEEVTKEVLTVAIQATISTPHQ